MEKVTVTSTVVRAVSDIVSAVFTFVFTSVVLLAVLFAGGYAIVAFDWTGLLVTLFVLFVVYVWADYVERKQG